MPLTIENTLGVMVIGVILSTLLWGVVCTQLFTYFRSSPEDSRAFKALVAVTWLVDAALQVMIISTLYNYTVLHFDNVLFLLHVEKTVPASVPLLQISATFVQGFYVHRIWRLSRRNIPITAIAVLIIAAEVAASVLYTVKAIPITNFLEVNAKMGPYMTTYSVISVVADWYIAGAMCILLARSRSRSKADSIVNRLIIFTFTTGLLPSVCAFVIFLSHVTERDGLVYLAPFFCIGKLYVISFLASLNMRGSVRAALHASTPLEMEPRSGIPFNSKRTQGTEVPSSTQLSIKIDTIHEYVVDSNPAPALAPEGRRWSRPWAFTGQDRRDRSSDRVVVQALPTRSHSPGGQGDAYGEHAGRYEKTARDRDVEGGYAI
jgi:hypothetical protein